MENLLIKYMDERVRLQENKPVIKRHGPVLTISRETGCSANAIAYLVQSHLKQARKGPEPCPWQIVNKEVVFRAAHELGVSPEKIQTAFKGEERKLFDEMLEALSNRYYKSYQKILKTVSSIIQSVVDDGFVILVGRGGVAFTRDIDKSLDLMFVAPLEWRISAIEKRMGYHHDIAKDFVTKTDKERRQLVDQFYGKPTDYSIYDAVINVSTMGEEHTTRIILQMMEMKNMI